MTQRSKSGNISETDVRWCRYGATANPDYQRGKNRNGDEQVTNREALQILRDDEACIPWKNLGYADIEAFNLAWNEAFEIALKALEGRTGHWYDCGSLSCRCSRCGCKSTEEARFCPRCGSENSEV